MIKQGKLSPKKMWKTLNSVLNRDSTLTSIQLLNVDGCNITGDKRLAEALNQHFVAVGPRLADELRFYKTTRSWKMLAGATTYL